MIYAFAAAAAMVAALMLAHRSGSPGLVRTGWAMAGNLLTVWVLVWSTGNFTPWQWFIAVDFVTAMIILRNPSGRPQAYIGAIYALQIIVHVAFGFGGASVFGARQYLDLLAFGGGCQLLILATGAIHGRGRKVADLGSGFCRAGGAVAPHQARVDAGP